MLQLSTAWQNERLNFIGNLLTHVRWRKALREDVGSHVIFSIKFFASCRINVISIVLVAWKSQSFCPCRIWQVFNNKDGSDNLHKNYLNFSATNVEAQRSILWVTQHCMSDSAVAIFTFQLSEFRIKISRSGRQVFSRYYWYEPGPPKTFVKVPHNILHNSSRSSRAGHLT